MNVNGIRKRSCDLPLPNARVIQRALKRIHYELSIFCQLMKNQ
jgi:hypothetical protein